MIRQLCAVYLLLAFASLQTATYAEIPVPTDAPRPKTPAESSQCVSISDGFRLEIVASEPFIRQPSGVCWDAHGRCYVSEMHGYNLEGHYDIVELNKTGQLDRVVRRIQAGPEARQAAEAETYGTIKRLEDTDGDGVVDQAVVFADRLPPCHGICAARDGIIATCGTEIIFLADRDGDDAAEVRDVLFRGFELGGLERAINSPRWTREGWIEICCAGTAGLITGPGLKSPVQLPNTDFRIRSDGSAIEPILGSSRTFGATQTERGERIVISTNGPGIAVAPILWNYLRRNPDYAPGKLEEMMGPRKTFPASQPHPWRTRRADDPGFSNFYTKSYGVSETSPNGYFTSACSPLVYQDHVLPKLHGDLLTCEPAQNMVFRGTLSQTGTSLKVTRPVQERHSEFLASSDAWFNPISLVHSPDGCIYLVDYYREIIEDYSAVPRYLQQEYGLDHGNEYGRLWRLSHPDAQPAAIINLAALSDLELVPHLQSEILWRRQTASRLLIERGAVAQKTQIAALVTSEASPAVVENALYTLRELGVLRPETVLIAMLSEDAGVRIHGLRLAEPWLDRSAELFNQTLKLAQDNDTCVVLQAALTLGESQNPAVVDALTRIARQHGQARWMDVAILSSLAGRMGGILQQLLTENHSLQQAEGLVTPLAAAISSRHDPEELSRLLIQVPQLSDAKLQRQCWDGLVAGASRSGNVKLTTKAIQALIGATEQADPSLRRLAHTLVQRWSLETAEERQQRLARLLETIDDLHADIDIKMAAVAEASDADDPRATAGLLEAVSSSSPQLRDAILGGLFSRQDRLQDIMLALERQSLPGNFLTAIQRSALLNHHDDELRQRAETYFKGRATNIEQKLAEFRAALQLEGNLDRGAVLFAKHCANCHQARGVGFAVGPDLNAEAKRSTETILRDIIDPSGTISANYGTYSLLTTDGRVFSGLMSAESASSLILKQPGGKSESFLRKDIEELKASPVSLMPDNLLESLNPQDVADILTWLRSPPPDSVGQNNGGEK